MAKLKVLSGKAVCQILKQHDFVEVRRRGSHVVMQRHNSPEETVTVPAHYYRLSDNPVYLERNLNLNYESEDFIRQTLG